MKSQSIHQWKLVGLKQPTEKIKCPYCSKTVKKAGKLSQHHRLKHQGKPFLGPENSKKQPPKSNSPQMSPWFSTKPKPITKKKKFRKAHVFRQNQDKVDLTERYGKAPWGSKGEFAKQVGISRNDVYRWRNNKGTFILEFHILLILRSQFLLGKP